MKIFENTEDGYRSLAWFAYIGDFCLSFLMFIPPVMPLAAIVAVGIYIIVHVNIERTKSTVYYSHLKNYQTVFRVSIMVTGMVMLFTFVTFGFGGFVGAPVAVIMLCWYMYRIIKGMSRLSLSKPYEETAVKQAASTTA